MSELIVIGGTVLAVGLNLTGSVLFYEYFNGKRLLKDIPQMMFFVGVFCCTTNLAYGLLLHDSGLYINGIICEIIQITFLTVYLFLIANKEFSKWFLYVFIEYNLTLEILYIFYDVIKHHTSFEFADNFTGWFNVGMTILNAGAPGQKIIEVWKTGNFTLIPIVTTIAQIFCSGLWGVYGLIIKNKQTIVANIIGFFLCTVQIFSYFYFYIKRHGVPPKNENEKEEKDEKQVSGSAKLIENNHQDSTETDPSEEVAP